MSWRVEDLPYEDADDATFEALAQLTAALYPDRPIERCRRQARAGPPGPMVARPRPAILLVRDGGRALARAYTFAREIATADGPLTVLALANVCSHPDHRGEGLGKAVVRAAFRKVDRGECPWCLFQTSTAVRPFYEKLGATVVGNRFVNGLAEDPAANPFWNEVIMRYPSGEGWPVGEIDLRGPAY